MATLGNIPNIEYNITKGNLQAVKALHTIIFGNEGVPRKIRRALRTFAGFEFIKNSDEYVTKLHDVQNQLDVTDLIAVCHILNLDYCGNKDELADRICSFLISLDVQDVEEEDDEEDEEEDDEEDEEEDNEEDDNAMGNGNINDVSQRLNSDESGVSSQHNTTRGSQGRTDGGRRDAFSLTFRDIEDSIRTFDGKDEYPIHKWIRDFEEIAEITGWNDLQKLIFAKKSLRGLAKLFIQSEQGIKSWTTLKKRFN